MLNAFEIGSLVVAFVESCSRHWSRSAASRRRMGVFLFVSEQLTFMTRSTLIRRAHLHHVTSPASTASTDLKIPFRGYCFCLHDAALWTDCGVSSFTTLHFGVVLDMMAWLHAK